MFKSSLLLPLGAALLLGAISTPAHAKGAKAAGAGAGKEDRKQGRAVFTKYDKNTNGVLDPDEREALRTDFKSDTALTFLDKDKDGVLSDSEIDALKAGGGQKKKKKDK